MQEPISHQARGIRSSSPIAARSVISTPAFVPARPGVLVPGGVAAGGALLMADRAAPQASAADVAGAGTPQSKAGAAGRASRQPAAGGSSGAATPQSAVDGAAGSASLKSAADGAAGSASLKSVGAAGTRSPQGAAGGAAGPVSLNSPGGGAAGGTSPKSPAGGAPSMAGSPPPGDGPAPSSSRNWASQSMASATASLAWVFMCYLPRSTRGRCGTTSPWPLLFSCRGLRMSGTGPPVMGMPPGGQATAAIQGPAARSRPAVWK